MHLQHFVESNGEKIGGCVDRLNEIAIFIRVLDAGSISAAARSLGLSPALASKRIISLEKHLGVRLLHRTTRKVSATSEGLELAKSGRPLIEDVESLISGLAQSAHNISGSLKITAPVSFGRHCLSPLLPGFLKDHPQLKVQAHLSDEMCDVIGEGYDLAIRIAGQLPNSELIARKLVSSCRVLCASPAYIAAHGAPETPEDLQHHACLIHAFSTQAENQWPLTNTKGQTFTVPVTGPLQSNLGDALKEAALSGVGISLHTIWHVCEDIQAGRLVHLLPDYSTESSIYAMTPNRRLVPPRVKAFMDYLVGHLEAEDWFHYS